MSTLIEMLKVVEKNIFNRIYQNLELMKADLSELLKLEIMSGLKKAKHYDSLCNGKLAEDFGFKAGEGWKFADSVVEAVLTSLQVIPSKTRDNITINIVAYRADLSDALSSTSASYPSKGGQVDWLTWLLLRGNDVIIKDWGVVKDRINKASSRSGKAIMAKVPSPLSVSFSVRGDFSGTRDNNWITEAARISREPMIEILKTFIAKATRI